MARCLRGSAGTCSTCRTGFMLRRSSQLLALELVLVWMLFLPRRWRIVCFLIVTPGRTGVILTANYTFLNYLVLALGFLLLDDRFLRALLAANGGRNRSRTWIRHPNANADCKIQDVCVSSVSGQWKISEADALFLTWIFYATTAQLIWMFSPVPLPMSPVTALEPFRIANRYGLFAIMTRGRYEIEFQGSEDGQNWMAYPFRYKPQDPEKPPAHLRALSAALRLEPVVCFVGLVAGISHRAKNRGAAALERQGRAGSFCPTILSRRTAAGDSRGAMAILVYVDVGKTRDRNVVAAATGRTVRAYAGAHSGWRYYGYPIAHRAAQGVSDGRAFSGSGCNTLAAVAILWRTESQGRIALIATAKPWCRAVTAKNLPGNCVQTRF